MRIGSVTSKTLTKTQYKIGYTADLDCQWQLSRRWALCCRATTTQLFIDENQQLMTDKPQYYLDWPRKYGIIGEDEF